MSILLEALRKSEKSQHSHEVPTIHTDDQSGPFSEPLKTGPLAALLVAALFISGWFVWQQYRPPVRSAGLSAASDQPLPSDSQTPEVALQSSVNEVVDTGSMAVSPVTDSAPGGALNEFQAQSSNPLADNAGPQQRTPTESYKEPAEKDAQPPPAKPEVVVDRQATAASVDAGKSQPVVSKPAKREPVTLTQEKSRPQEPAPITYWELPDAVRANLPEIKFSVLVYAQNPEDRFVLINGVRLAEGDSPQPNLVVKEIRREGVLFSYRLYQFLVER